MEKENLTRLLYQLRAAKHHLAQAMDGDSTRAVYRLLNDINDVITDIERQLGYYSVYHISNGSADELLYTGELSSCRIYCDCWIEGHPEDKFNLITIEV